MFNWFNHLAVRVDLAEARLSAAFEHRLSTDLEKKHRIAFLLLGLAYTLFSLVFRIILTTFLLFLYLLLRIVIPILFLWFFLSFGVSSVVTLYQSTVYTSLIGSPQDILQAVPGVMVIALFLTIYLSLALVIARSYRRTFFAPATTP